MNIVSRAGTEPHTSRLILVTTLTELSFTEFLVSCTYIPVFKPVAVAESVYLVS